MSSQENRELNELMGAGCGSNGDQKKAFMRSVRQYGDEDELVADPKTAEKKTLGGFVQWTTSDEKRFLPAAKTAPAIIPGVYEIMTSPSVGIFFEKIPVLTKGLIRFPQTNSNKVVSEIQTFWEREDLFKEYKLSYKRGIILWGPAGCHAKGTDILMYNGTTKKVEDVKCGDLLMGPDSKSREVMVLCRGVDDMYKFTPTWGPSFIVNAHHVLHLETNKHDSFFEPVVHVKVKDYLQWNQSKKQEYKLAHVQETKQFAGIKHVEPVGRDNFYGFTLSGDHLYLTADHVIHENSGKSSTLQLIMEDVVTRNGVVFKFTAPSLFIEGIRIFREIQPMTPIVVLMEDIDSILDCYNESEVLNILDGVDQCDRSVFIATTNYPERLGPRIVNRPSRFDKRFKIGHPNPESRKLYLNHVIGGEKRAAELKIDVDKWVADTEGFSIAHLKELFVAVIVLRDDYDDAVETLSTMKEDISSDDDRDKLMGFGGHITKKKPDPYHN